MGLLAPVPRAAAQAVAPGRPVLRIAPTTEQIRIDGRLTEAAWSLADSIEGLTQVEPVEGAAATARTVVRVLTMGDLQTLAVYCALYARWEKAEAKLAELNGAWIVKTPNDHLQAIPWIQISNRAAELMKGYLSELGMTPASRARMGVDDNQAQRPGQQNRPQIGGRFAEYMGRK